MSVADKIEVDAAKSALVVIDLQNRTAGMKTLPHDARKVIGNAVRLADRFRDLGGLVILVRGEPVPPVGLRPEGDIRQPPFGDRASDWADIVRELGPAEDDVVVTKRQWGAFYGTDLELQLRRRGIDTIVLCGIATNRGVESTARFAFEFGFRQIFAEDAMASRSAEEHHNTVSNIFRAIGYVRSTEEIVSIIH